ncbi:MAG: hypothetical protein PVF79_21505, partial [Desulfobacterales bacterium]
LILKILFRVVSYGLVADAIWYTPFLFPLNKGLRASNGTCFFVTMPDRKNQNHYLLILDVAQDTKISNAISPETGMVSF